MTSHPDTNITLPIWHTILLLGPPMAAAAAALWARPGTSCAGAWRAARWAVSLALGFAALSLAAVAFGSQGAGQGVRADAVGAVMLLLVSFVGWVVVRYSQTYLNGEPREQHYVRWLMATLAAVGLVVATNHVLVLVLGWTATSMALHRLLTFFGERPLAVVAAHKKFIIGRAADLCMLVAAGLLFQAFGTLQIDQLSAQALAAPQLPGTAKVAVLLIACAALLKSAQLPFHGWLIQVMEAPTPVSALLHAGIVNLGGFVLIRFAPLVADVPAVQALLVAVGTATAVLAALVMTTRISIKVMLAWSTCAQMGFMLMQCGLGAWEMALLHLVAHSLYKAHAFLGAGGAVRRAMLVQLAPRARAPGPLALVAGALVGAGMVLVAGAAVGMVNPGHAASPAIWVLAGIVALALVPLVHAHALRLGGLWLPALGVGAFSVALAYFGLHAMFASWVQPGSSTPAAAPLICVALAFCALFVLQSTIALAPQGTLARGLYPWFYGGLFLDEKFNRAAFAVWRPPLPVAAAALLPATDTTTALKNTTTSAGVRT
ncbi:MAG: NADH-quinone oxidoreductase subunit L [Rhodoferax sp.]|nr:NADH-quinone oxidoreductase subunit L [Rhodoferax sp.]